MSSVRSLASRLLCRPGASVVYRNRASALVLLLGPCSSPIEYVQWNRNPQQSDKRLSVMMLDSPLWLIYWEEPLQLSSLLEISTFHCACPWVELQGGVTARRFWHRSHARGSLSYPGHPFDCMYIYTTQILLGRGLFLSSILCRQNSSAQKQAGLFRPDGSF